MPSLLRIINRITPPIIWDAGKRVLRRGGDEQVPFVDRATGSFSQYGEDLVIDALLGCPSSGFYVDVGANDPDELSNTKRFYLRGWRGLNIEPQPDLHERLVASRPEDVNLNIGLSDHDGELVFHRMDPSTLSTFDSDAVRENLKHPGARLIASEPLPVRTLAAVLSEYGSGEIDLLSIDVEGHEIPVLSGNDWARFRPRTIMVEVDHTGSPVPEFLCERGYRFVWSNGTNGIFMREDLATTI